VVDPYIQNATFFWDKNKDNIKQANEPVSSRSDKNGRFKFNLKIPNGQRVLMRKKGFHNGVAYTGVLSANINKQGVVSPLTTFEVKYPEINIIEMFQEVDITIFKDDRLVCLLILFLKSDATIFRRFFYFNR